jgi:hypothetical protein
VDVSDADRPSNFLDFFLVAFDVLSFPFCEPLNPKIYVIYGKNFFLCINGLNVVHDIRGFIKIFKVEISVPRENHIVLFSFASQNLSPKFLKMKLTKVKKLLLFSIYIMLFPLLIRVLYLFILLDFKDSLEASMMTFLAILLFIIPRVGCFIFLFTQYFDVDGSREGCHKIMVH